MKGKLTIRIGWKGKSRGIKIFFLFSLSVSILLTAGTLSGEDKIRTQGMATIYGGAIDVARDKAIENALRNAVEEKAGVLIKSYTEVENFTVTMDQILSESKGFVNNYRILSEGRENNTYKVLIEADIGTGKLKERMDAIALVLARKSKPRLMVLFSGDVQKVGLAEATIIKYLMSQGFKVVDPKTIKSSARQAGLNITGDNPSAVTNVAREYGAEVVIVGNMEVINRPFKMGDIEIVTSEVTISGKALNGDTGEVIATGTKSKKGELKTSTEEVAKELARSLGNNIVEKWSHELSNVQTVKLFISGLNTYGDLNMLKDLLSTRVKGVKQIHQRSYKEGQVELDLEVRGNTQQVADDLEALTHNGRRMRIKEITANKIEAQFR
ncbi:MAG: flagellar assembly protein T N-terminal domain-containing protein [Syntrophales bacterium]|nr:flagellar assembly protein T N-terminal domain-containing protein [Syntrophales bacterium]